MNTKSANISAKKRVHNPLFSITPFTLLDFPDTPACIFWFAGCNFRCPYCYNPEIVFGEGKVSEDEALSFLKKRRGLLEGVVLSGGEVTLYKNLPEFAKNIKELGFLVKLDTNGSNPAMLKTLLDQGLLDFVAVDFKAPKEKFEVVAKNSAFYKLIDSINLLQESKIEYEIRTTYHSELLCENDIKEILASVKTLGYKKPLFVQNALDDTPTITELGKNLRLHSTNPQITLR